jgi:valyl-tRNA synthetase
MDNLQELVSGFRRFRASHGLGARRDLTPVIHDREGVWEDWWEPQLMALASSTPTLGEPPRGGGHMRVVAGAVHAYIPVAGLVDVEAERVRLTGRVKKVESALQRAERKLSNPSFRERAPAEIVAKEEAKAAEARNSLEALAEQLDSLPE